MSNCITVYLDQQGEKHPAYYSIVAKSGHKIALQSYLKAMTPLLSSNFQRTTIKELVKENTDLRTRPRRKGAKKGPTESKRLVGQFNNTIAARESVLYQKGIELLEEDPTRSREDVMRSAPGIRDGIIARYKKKAENYYKEASNQDEYLAKVENTLARWKEDLNERSEYHTIIEDYINARVAAKAAGESIVDFKKKFLSQNSGVSEMHSKVIDLIDEFVNKELPTGDHITIIPEMHIDVDSWNNLSKIDLFVHDANTGIVTIYDFKFYTEKSMKDYSTIFRGHLKDPVKHLKNNSRDFNALQMSEYTRMLQEKGFNSVRAYIVPFVLKIDKDESTEDKTRFEDVTRHVTLSTSYKKTEIETILTDLKKIDLDKTSNKRRVPNKISSIDTLYSDATSKSNIVSQLIKQVKSSIDSVSTTVDEDGIHRYTNSITGNKEVIPGNTKEERVKFLEEYIKIRDKYKLKLEDSILDFLNSDASAWNPGGKINKSGKGAPSLKELLNNIENEMLDESGRVGSKSAIDTILESVNKAFSESTTIEASIRQAFRGMSVQNYHFDKISNDERFKHFDKTIIQATHKVTGAISLVLISPTAKSTMEYSHENSKSYNNILGNYITTREANARLISRSDSQFDMELMMLGAIYKEMKHDNPALTLLPPKIAILKGRSISSRSINMVELDKIVTTLSNIIPAESITTDYKKILNKSFIDKGTMLNHFTLDAINAIESDAFFSTDKQFADKGLVLTEHLASIQFSKGENYNKAMELLHDLMGSINLQFDLGNIEGDPASYNWYTSLNNLLLALEGFDPLVNIGERDVKGKMWASVTTAGNAKHQYINKINTIYKSAQTKVFNEYIDRHTIQDKLVKAYMKSEGISANLISPTAKREAFRKLFKVVDHKTLTAKNVAANLMVLKTPATAHNPQAKALIEHLIHMQEEMLELNMGKERFDVFVQSTKYVKGAMPVLKQSRESAAEEGTSKEGLLKRWLDGISTRKVSAREARSTGLTPDIYNPYVAQATSLDDRLDAAGFDTAGNIVKPDIQLEFNPDILFETMVLDSLTQKYFSRALSIKSAVDVALHMQEIHGNAKTGLFRDMLQSYTDLIVHQSQANAFEEETDSAVVKWSSLLAKTTLALSPGYMIMETATNTFNLLAESTNQFFTKLFLGEDANVHFTPTSMGQAFSEVVSNFKLTQQIAAKYGMLIRDPSRLKSEKFRKSQSTIYTSKIFFWINSFPIEISQTLVLVAKMIHEGSYQAHKLDADGVLIYDETQDKRFFEQKGESISDKEIKKRKALHSFYKDQFDIEDGLKENGQFKRALTNTDIATVHTLTTERFSSLSADQKVIFESIAIGIAFMRFKNWLVAKKETFFKSYNPESELKHNLKWVEAHEHPDGGFFTYVGDPSEGLFNSLWAVMNGYTIKGFDMTKDVPPELLLVRKKNVIRLGNDLLWTAMLWYFISKLFEKDTRQVLTSKGKWKKIEIPLDTWDKNLHRVLYNSVTDLTFVLPMYDMFFNSQSSPVPIVSAIGRLGNAVFGGIVATAEGDWEKALSKVNNIGRISGLVRGIEDYGIGGYEHFK